MNHAYSDRPDLLCFSHLRWDFVFQRPQHLMSRFARRGRVFFLEEPIRDSIDGVSLQSRVCAATGVTVLTPHVPPDDQTGQGAGVADALAEYLQRQQVRHPIAWFYTPMALEYFTEDLAPSLVVYDCMDELSLFRNAPPLLRDREEHLFRIADLVFTGGISLFEHKRAKHPNVHPFPSGVDVAHFAKARSVESSQQEYAGMAKPRIGYAGVIDERMDLPLIDQAAALLPAWQFVMVGPVVKIELNSLPRRANIHWLGMKQYDTLPGHFAAWDVAMMPFALNDSTRFISPTKTPEYLSAGLPVISTAIRDVVRPYGELGLVRIVHDAGEFALAAEQALRFGMSLKWRERADAFLATLSWDNVWNEMNALIESRLQLRRGVAAEAATSARESSHV